ncbi:hypothetical protein LTR33_018617, partial [Friedmanniomyces endolithicus]
MKGMRQRSRGPRDVGGGKKEGGGGGGAGMSDADKAKAEARKQRFAAPAVVN